VPIENKTHTKEIEIKAQSNDKEINILMNEQVRV
jgi:hypothetical protein